MADFLNWNEIMNIKKRSLFNSTWLIKTILWSLPLTWCQKWLFGVSNESLQQLLSFDTPNNHLWPIYYSKFCVIKDLNLSSKGNNKSNGKTTVKLGFLPFLLKTQWKNWPPVLCLWSQTKPQWLILVYYTTTTFPHKNIFFKLPALLIIGAISGHWGQGDWDQYLTGA